METADARVWPAGDLERIPLLHYQVFVLVEHVGVVVESISDTLIPTKCVGSHLARGAGSAVSTGLWVSGSHNCTPWRANNGRSWVSWSSRKARSYSLTTTASNPRSGWARAANSAAA